MSVRSFFANEKPFSVGEVASLVGAELRRNPSPGRAVTGIAALDHAGPADLAFLDNLKFTRQACDSSAGACLTSERFTEFVPAGTALLIAPQPFHAFVIAARALYPGALRPSSIFERKGVAPGAAVHASAHLESGVTIDPGVVVGPGAEIGSGTIIGANAVIGPDVRIGRNCNIGANATIAHAFIGDRVILHPGCLIGQDGFGYVMGPQGHRKIPQIGRVIIQDDVEIGAGTAIDRGALRDTVIGEGTKIDNQVQIAHNVAIGRHCVLVAQTGIAGSATLEDFVVLGAKAGIKDHVTVGEGAQIAATASVAGDVPAGGRWAGTPAKPAAQWLRELAAVNRLGRAVEPDGRR